MRSWPDLLWRPIQSQDERNLIEANATALSAPASRSWVLARVAALLTGYYVADIPAEIMRFEAEDWEVGLREFPEWAITKAVRWWKGESNVDRRKKPQVGDIAIRARHEMGAVCVARLAVKRFDEGRPLFTRKQDEPLEPGDAELRSRNANEILAKAGFTLKRFGGSE
jgi:hypothetical protein